MYSQRGIQRLQFGWYQTPDHLDISWLQLAYRYMISIDSSRSDLPNLLSVIDLMNPGSFLTELSDSNIWWNNNSKSTKWLVRQGVRIWWEELYTKWEPAQRWRCHWHGHRDYLLLLVRWEQMQSLQLIPICCGKKGESIDSSNRSCDARTMEGEVGEGEKISESSLEIHATAPTRFKVWDKPI